MIEIAFRNNDTSTPFPQQPKLDKPEVKGFTKAQPWHCKPFVDARTLGVELSWPWNYSLIISNVDGKIICHRQATGGPITEHPQALSVFAEGHYGVSSAHQLLLPEGYNGLILPHPRSYTISEMPALIPGVLQMDWWPHIFFVVSQIPRPGARHIWAAGQPFAQVVPYKREETSLREMSLEEKIEWDRREKFVNDFRYQIATHTWVDDRGSTFNNRYRVLPGMIKELGWDGLMTKGTSTKAKK